MCGREGTCYCRAAFVTDAFIKLATTTSAATASTSTTLPGCCGFLCGRFVSRPRWLFKTLEFCTPLASGSSVSRIVRLPSVFAVEVMLHPLKKFEVVLVLSFDEFFDVDGFRYRLFGKNVLNNLYTTCERACMSTLKDI